MTLSQLLVTSGGLLLIWFIYWFFFGKRDDIVESSADIKVLVDGGYRPSSIKIKKGAETTLKITRTDKNSCLEEIVLPDFKIKQYLPLNEEVEVKIKSEKAGEFEFHCGMNMYHGKIIVE